MEKNSIETGEKLNTLFTLWLIRIYQTAMLCMVSLTTILDLFRLNTVIKNPLGLKAWQEIPEVSDCSTAEEIFAKLNKMTRDYFQESIKEGTCVAVDLTFDKISEIPRRYFVAIRESGEIGQYVRYILKEMSTTKEAAKSSIPLPPLSWIIQTDVAVTSLYEEVKSCLDLNKYGEMLEKLMNKNFNEKRAFYKQLKTRLIKKSKRHEAVNIALDELSKKHGESWRHFRLKKKFDLLWEHPIKGKKTFGKFLEQGGIKKGKDGRQRTVEEMIKYHDLKGEMEGDLP